MDDGGLGWGLDLVCSDEDLARGLDVETDFTGDGPEESSAERSGPVSVAGERRDALFFGNVGDADESGGVVGRASKVVCNSIEGVYYECGTRQTVSRLDL